MSWAYFLRRNWRPSLKGTRSATSLLLLAQVPRAAPGKAMPKTRSKTLAERNADDSEQCCAICMYPPPPGEGAHRCGTCKPGSWVVCSECDAALTGRACPICRTDYARAKAEWEDLPPSTKFLCIHERPTQAELLKIAAAFPSLEILKFEIVDYDEEEEEPQLDFAAPGVVFPALLELTLNSVHLKSITFNEINTPLLRALELHNAMGECCPFALSLPHLQRFKAQHTMLGERIVDAGQFGLSLSRCPKLEVFISYKFRMLGESNYLVLPSMRLMRLHRAECLSHLDIVYAPKLSELSLRSAWDCRDFKLRNVPSATADDVATLLVKLAEAREDAREAAVAEDSRWRAQGAAERRKLTREAQRRNWIRDGMSWNVSAENPMIHHGSGHGDEWYGTLEEALCEHCSDVAERVFRALEAEALADAFPPSTPDASLPKLEIDTSDGGDIPLDELEPCVRGRVQEVDEHGSNGVPVTGMPLSRGPPRFSMNPGPYPPGFFDFGDDDDDDDDDELDEDEDEEDMLSGLAPNFALNSFMQSMLSQHLQMQVMQNYQSARRSARSAAQQVSPSVPAGYEADYEGYPGSEPVETFGEPAAAAPSRRGRRRQRENAGSAEQPTRSTRRLRSWVD